MQGAARGLQSRRLRGGRRLGQDRRRDGRPAWGAGPLVGRLPPPDPAARLRLWVDRPFTIRGSGTVVTGTLGEGRVSVGDELEVGGRTVRVRGLQSLERPREEVCAVARVAVNLRGVAADEIARGSVLLAPGAWRPTSAVDVRLSTDACELPARAMLHIGTAAQEVRLRPLSGARPPPAARGTATASGRPRHPARPRRPAGGCRRRGPRRRSAPAAAPGRRGEARPGACGGNRGA